MKTLETERLILRAWRPDDLDAFYAYAKSPNVGPNAGWKPHDSLEESREILDAFIQADETWAIVPREAGRPAGSIGLHADTTRKNIASRMLGYVLAEEYWGRGLMLEAVRAVLDFAFTDFELEVLSVQHYPHNARSRRVIEKCGFTYEGTVRRANRLYDGTVVDHLCYSMLLEEYRKLKG